MALRVSALFAACLALALACATHAASQDFELPLFIPAITSIPLSLDSDGDGLPDVWELRGYVENGVFVNLPAMGANPRRKDLFVWMDYMVENEGQPGETSFAPSQTVIDNIKAVFANAAATNPDGTAGIVIHPVLKNKVPYKANLGVAGDDASVWTDFDALKNASFDKSYVRSYRYMIWANDYQSSGSSGLARNIPATDFIVSLGTFNPSGGTDWEKLGTFIHELGHCLGLRHGGPNDTNYKPNYLSIMNYTFQFSGLHKDGHFGEAGYPLRYDYQRMATPTLDENNLNEPAGLTGAADISAYGTQFYYYSNAQCIKVAISGAASPIDWNRDNRYTTGVQFVIRCDAGETTPQPEAPEVLATQNDWAHINYNAGGLLGPSMTKSQRQSRLAAPIPESLKHEMTYEMYQKIRNAPSAP
ncbi:hypothetical protein [Solidesulfovibrio alcoholivorans]|uniref:hypothetical protein n=1 Tax=Solidesulfovibrio alcoholivorans TaxID=81406 RepID=UPI0006947711|nr:hypothetical protein [Solidesulfovibrio alcoholivorans]